MELLAIKPTFILFGDSLVEVDFELNDGIMTITTCGKKKKYECVITDNIYLYENAKLFAKIEKWNQTVLKYSEYKNGEIVFSGRIY